METSVDLAEAFRLFNQTSDELTMAYGALGRQVESLTAELAAANAEADRLREEAERNRRLTAMGEMAAQLAHQLRTPLAAALLYAGNLENPVIPEGSRMVIAGKIVARLTHLERLIQDMLLFARGEVLGRETFAIADLLGELAHTFEPVALMRHISLSMTSAENNPSSPLAGISANLSVSAHFSLPFKGRAGVGMGLDSMDTNPIPHLTSPLKGEEQDKLALMPLEGEGQGQRRLSMVGNRKALSGAIANLIDNALQATEPAGWVRLQVTQEENRVIFTVRDSGRGMSPEVVARLFEPFYTTRAEGTGLGLAIARGVARAHGGSIEVSSVLGQGTEFILSLPLCPNT